MPSPTECVLAIDIGGTKLAAGLVSRDGRVLASVRSPTRGDGGAEELYRDLLQLIGQLPDSARPQACGVGCGGPMAPGGATVSPLNIPAWRDFPLLERLTDDTGLPVIVDNDAKALALAEGWRGAARGVRNFLAMVVSTGVGGGLVLDCRLIDGNSGNAGHIGHVCVVPDGNRCGCGAYGCLEAEISGTGIKARTGLRPEQVGDAERARAASLLGLALVSAAGLLDLALVVVGGSIALGFGEPFFRRARASYAERVGLHYAKGCRIEPVGLGADAPLVGAAALGWRSLGVEVLNA